MRQEYEKLIAEHDNMLRLQRKEWMAAKPSDKAKWFERINGTLDERLRLMKLRDESTITA